MGAGKAGILLRGSFVMTDTRELIELAARAIAAHEEWAKRFDEPDWEDSRLEALQIAKTVIAAINASGTHAILPVEATNAMAEAYLTLPERDPEHGWNGPIANDAWSAMVSDGLRLPLTPDTGEGQMSGKKERIIELVMALDFAAARFEDIASIIQEKGPYADMGFLRASARRCRSTIAGLTWNENVRPGETFTRTDGPGW